MALRKKSPLAVRAWKKVAIAGPDECWLWTGAVGGNKRQGHIITGGRGSKFIVASRAIWESVNGPVPDGIEVCHRCDTPRCCNPSHLFLGTHKENMLDMARKLRSPRRKLSLEAVNELRAAWKTGRFSYTSLAKRFGISRPHVANIVTGKQWVGIA